jgi:hypothetical protein
LLKERPTWADTKKVISLSVSMDGMSAIMSRRTGSAGKNLTGFAMIRKPKSHVKQLCDEYMGDRVNTGIENTGRIGVVEFWGEVYLSPIESNSNVKPSTLHSH